MVGGSLAKVFKAALLGPLISRSKKMSIVVWKPNKKEDMGFLTELLESGKVVPVIDRRYPLSETAEAFRYFEGGLHQGKIVITVEHNNKS
jgi:NADPH:quinone reductase-like Zn-dependent oxidoreductase